MAKIYIILTKYIFFVIFYQKSLKITNYQKKSDILVVNLIFGKMSKNDKKNKKNKYFC